MITSTASRKVPSKWLKWANSYSRYSSISVSVQCFDEQKLMSFVPGEIEFHHLCVFTGQKRIPDNLSVSWINQGRKDLFEKGRGPEGMVLFTEGGRRDMRGIIFWVTKSSHFSFMWIKRNPPTIPPTPSYTRPKWLEPWPEERNAAVRTRWLPRRLLWWWW